MKKLLSSGNTNAKTKKNQRPTRILYLHPSKIEGKEMCPYASENCRIVCLNTAGRGAMNSVQEARIRRTKYYVLNRDAFYNQLYNEIQSFSKYYVNKGKEVAIRLNGTSDQPLVETLFRQVRRFNYNIAFYDYTKNYKKAGIRYGIDGNRYVVAFSYSEKPEAYEQSLDVLKRGGIVAMVFDKLPKTWHGYEVVNGDERDDMMLDIGGGKILGLLAKGKAKHDESGFVVKYTGEHMHRPVPQMQYDDEYRHWERLASHYERFTD